ncbi:hypothetical protein [Faucicola boevrei]|uniref:hypothetical protein n=1 Tax=Faucicola boevrei TaxID=346665 RepID=UPI0003A9D3D6|nr:hypothetical protein [Moraxella boevrei]
MAERLENPHVPSANLSSSQNRYKIKLRMVGYCLFYDAMEQRKLSEQHKIIDEA